MQIVDIATGNWLPDVPTKVTRIHVYVKSALGDYAEYIRPEELDAYLDTHDVKGYDTVEVSDPDYIRERRKAISHLWATSCLMPPTEDLQLIIAAKRTAPEDWKTIDPQAGSWRDTQRRLELIKNEKKCEAIYPSTP